MSDLYAIAQKYVEIIEKIEKTSDKNCLYKLEEQRVIWHNAFIDALRKEGIPYKDREDVCLIAFRILKGGE